MNEEKFSPLRAKLVEEKQTLESELENLAPGGAGEETAFRDEVADRLEEQEDREAASLNLRSRLKEVEAALTRWQDGSYGHCRVCGITIETERLEANPAATTCKQHLR